MVSLQHHFTGASGQTTVTLSQVNYSIPLFQSFAPKPIAYFVSSLLYPTQATVSEATVLLLNSAFRTLNTSSRFRSRLQCPLLSLSHPHLQYPSSPSYRTPYSSPAHSWLPPSVLLFFLGSWRGGAIDRPGRHGIPAHQWRL